MERIRDKIRKSLALESDEFREEYREDPIRFLTEKCGRKYPRKLRKFFEDIYFLREKRGLVKANRGGGKSTVVADLAACLYALRDFDGFIVGGAEVQAKNDYRYAAQVLQIDDRLDDFHEEILKTLCTSHRGNWLKFVAASTKQVRGPHCGDPHRQMNNNMESHGGITFIDEECEADPDIVSAVKYTINTADPGILIRLSTLHKITGTFAELCEDPGSQNYKLYEWDCFDTVEKCDRSCKKCRFEFAGKKRPGFAEWGKQHPEWQHDKGYCEGRAKEGGGWRTIESIEASFLGALNLEEFEVEEMGWRKAAGGQVLEPVLLDQCLRGPAVYLPGMPVLFTIDWGMRGWCIIHVLQKQKDGVIVVLRTEYYHETRDEIIYDRCDILKDLFGGSIVCADGSHPYENENLKYRGYDVEEVHFAKWKDYGAGWIKGLTERGKLWIQGEIKNGKKFFVNGETERFYDELKKWKRDKSGKIIKKDDHGPDSLLCGAARWGKGGPWKMEYSSANRRSSYDLVGVR